MIAAGTRAGIILTERNSVYTFGTGLLGFNGESGDSQSPMPIPIPREFFGGAKPTAVFAGQEVFGVITDIGELYTWGRSSSNATGLYENEAKIIQPFPWRADKAWLQFLHIFTIYESHEEF